MKDYEIVSFIHLVGTSSAVDEALFKKFVRETRNELAGKLPPEHYLSSFILVGPTGEALYEKKTLLLGLRGRLEWIGAVLGEEGKLLLPPQIKERRELLSFLARLEG
jgi:hypothetical protein